MSRKSFISLIDSLDNTRYKVNVLALALSFCQVRDNLDEDDTNGLNLIVGEISQALTRLVDDLTTLKDSLRITPHEIHMARVLLHSIEPARAIN